MVPLPVIEDVKFPVTPAQSPDVNSRVPFIEVEVALALKEAAADPSIIASKLFPLTVPERVPSNVQLVPVTLAVPLTVSDPIA